MTHYELLGVSPTAPPDEVHRAYRRAIRHYHPDVNRAANAAQLTVRLNEAWATLADARTRAAYDRTLRTGEPEIESGVTAWQPHPSDFWPSRPGAYAPYRPPAAQRYASLIWGGVCFTLLFAFVVSAVHWLPLVAMICGSVVLARFFGRVLR